MNSVEGVEGFGEVGPDPDDQPAVDVVSSTSIKLTRLVEMEGVLELGADAVEHKLDAVVPQQDVTIEVDLV